MRRIRSPDPILFFLCSLLCAACGTKEHPSTTYLEREGPLLLSDSLVQVMVRMVDRIQELPLTGDRDLNLARELIEHHYATIELNNILIRDGKDPDLLSYAERLSSVQKTRITELKAFLEWHPEVPESGIRGAPDVMLDLGALQPTDDLDAAYQELMRMHLRDGLSIANQAKERGQHKEIRELAQGLIDTLSAAISELERIDLEKQDQG